LGLGWRDRGVGTVGVGTGRVGTGRVGTRRGGTGRGGTGRGGTGRGGTRRGGTGASGQWASGQGASGQGVSGQGAAGQGAAGQGAAGLGAAGQGAAGQGAAGPSVGTRKRAHHLRWSSKMLVVSDGSSLPDGGACRIPQRVLCGGRVPPGPAATFHGILRRSAGGRLAWCLRVPTCSLISIALSTDAIVCCEWWWRVSRGM
jgi:hypothetical protein